MRPPPLGDASLPALNSVCSLATLAEIERLAQSGALTTRGRRGMLASPELYHVEYRMIAAIDRADHHRRYR